MQKITTSTPGEIGPGTMLLNKLRGKTFAKVSTAVRRPVALLTKMTKPAPKPAAAIAPARHGLPLDIADLPNPKLSSRITPPGQQPEDPFAASLRAVTAHHESVLEQIKGVQREGSNAVETLPSRRPS